MYFLHHLGKVSPQSNREFRCLTTSFIPSFTRRLAVCGVWQRGSGRRTDRRKHRYTLQGMIGSVLQCRCLCSTSLRELTRLSLWVGVRVSGSCSRVCRRVEVWSVWPRLRSRCCGAKCAHET